MIRTFVGRLLARKIAPPPVRTSMTRFRPELKELGVRINPAMLVDNFAAGYAPDWTANTAGTSGVVSWLPTGAVALGGSSTPYTESGITRTVSADADFDIGADFTQNGPDDTAWRHGIDLTFASGRVVFHDTGWGNTEWYVYGPSQTPTIPEWHGGGAIAAGVEGLGTIQVSRYVKPDGGDVVTFWASHDGGPLVKVNELQFASLGELTSVSLRAWSHDYHGTSDLNVTLDNFYLRTVATTDPPKILITDRGNKGVGGAGLKVAKWQDAFQLNAAGTAVEIKEPNTTTDETAGWDFIDRDPDRFNVWVYDKPAYEAMTDGTPTYPHRQARISTTNVAGFTDYDDDATAIDLVRYTGDLRGPGWFYSNSQMLVSNEEDDKYKSATYLGVDDAPPTATDGVTKSGFTWKVSDRTHIVALRGTVKAEYTSEAGLVAEPATAGVPHTKNVKVHVMLLRNKAKADGGEEIVSQAVADVTMRWANEQFAQIGLLIIPTYIAVDPPAGVNLTDGLDVHPVTARDSNGKVQVTPEEAALLAHPLRTNATDDVELFFVNYFEPDDRRGEAFFASVNPDARFDDAVIIRKNFGKFTVAHELGHILLDKGHYLGPLKYANLMHSPTSIEEVTGTKRLLMSQQTLILGDSTADPPVLAARPHLLTGP